MTKVGLTHRRDAVWVWFGLVWFGLVGLSFNASREPQPRARRRARLAEDAPARHAFWTVCASAAWDAVLGGTNIVHMAEVPFLGALYPSKSGLMNKHIVKHSV